MNDAGPVLGAILTVSASGTSAKGIDLLATYAGLGLLPRDRAFH